MFMKHTPNETGKKRKYLWYLLAIVLVVIGLFIFQTNAQKYEQYFLTINFSLHGITLVRMACALIVVYANRTMINSSFSLSKNGEKIPLNKDIVYIYLIGLLLAGLGMFYPFMNRIGFYFLIYEIPFWGQTIYAKENRTIFRCFIAIVVLYVLVSLLLGDTEGIVDYTTFMQEGGYYR